MAPLISVIIASYNHGAFIEEAINSVLSQDHKNLEVIVVDDGSQDDSWSKISSLSDARVKKFLFEKNMGACKAANFALAQARGEYVCTINSDDRWKPGKLTDQLNWFSSNPGLSAVFGRADFIDQSGRPLELPKEDAGASVFNVGNRSRYEWLRHFFFNGNCICHPTLMIKRSVYEVIGDYDNRYRQLPDFRMWINFVKKFELHVMEKSLIEFRVHALNGGNASSPSEVNNRRTWNEHFLLAQEFFDDLSADDFYAAFSKDIRRPDIKSLEHMKCEQAFLLSKPIPWFSFMYNPVALNQLYGLLRDPVTARILEVDFGFTDRSFHDYSASMNTFYRTNALQDFSTPILVRETLRRIDNKGPVGTLKSLLKASMKKL